MSFNSVRRVAVASSSLPRLHAFRAVRYPTSGFATTTPSFRPANRESQDDGGSGPVASADSPQSASPRRMAKHATKAPRRTLEPSKTESFLLSLLTEGADPTLADLERLKPRRRPNPESDEYAVEYATLLDNICRSFSSDQLRDFSQQYGLSIGSKRKKRAYAEAIVERAWQWPSLRELKRMQRDRTEVTSQTLPLTASELFIVLGKDGSDLFQLSRKFNVYISVKPNPLAVYVEGSRESVREIESHISNVLKDMVEDIFEVPSKQSISKEVLQSVSRMAGAFVENIEGRKLRVRGINTTSITTAKRLAIRATYQVEPSELLMQHTYPSEEYSLPTSVPLAYSLYPFLAPRSLFSTSKSNMFFRWRRVGDWLGEARSQSLDASGLAQSRSSLFAIDGTKVNLHDRLLVNAPPHSASPTDSRRLVSASSGHILFPSAQADPKLSLKSMYNGQSTHSDTCSWISKQRSSATFLPSLPLELVRARPSQQQVVHRVVYRGLPAEGQEGSTMMRFIRLEVPLVEPREAQPQMDIQYNDLVKGATCWIGVATNVDLLMPDRHMDLRFIVSDAEPLPSDHQPTELLNYTRGLEDFLTSNEPNVTQPSPPMLLSHDGRDFVLTSSVSVRKSTESPTADFSPTSQVVSESILDLESGRHSAVCVVLSEGMSTLQEWESFLRKCDWMTAKDTSRNRGSF
ncbi:hypothetical protein BC834DRAFT_966842 [Gloeopeniophorella convolvens]|nr:hypothetical protein BC834DRAFT_966842 [Gloeopeniophorella convolvens]